MINNSNRKKVGLALGSGGWKGFSHIGVIKALVENDIPIDYIAGSSSGAIVGGLYAAFGDIYKVESIITSLGKRDLFSILSDIDFKSGILKGHNFTKFFDKLLGKVAIEDLKIPFWPISTDFITGKPFYIKEGSLARGLRYSGSVPLIFGVAKFDGHLLVDGGISEPIPTEAVREMGADVVIGVDLYAGSVPLIGINKANPSKASVLAGFIRLLVVKLSEECGKKADILVRPVIHDEVANFKVNYFFKFLKQTEIINLGYKATLEKIPEIKKLLMENTK
jgi:NTE family protein